MSGLSRGTRINLIFAVIALGIAAVMLLTFGSLRETFRRSLSSEAVVPLSEYHVADAGKILDLAGTDRERFNGTYVRVRFTDAVVFDALEAAGPAAWIVTTHAPGGARVQCALNKFRYETARDTLSGFKAGDTVRISGLIGTATTPAALVLGDGCIVEKSYAPLPAPEK